MFYFSYYFFSLDIKIFKYPTKKEIFTIFNFSIFTVARRR